MLMKGKKWGFSAELLAKSDRCIKGRECLEQGPKCKIGATLNQNILIVNCQIENNLCPFLRDSDNQQANTRGICSCPVRLAFYQQHAI